MRIGKLDEAFSIANCHQWAAICNRKCCFYSFNPLLTIVYGSVNMIMPMFGLFKVYFAFFVHIGSLLPI